MTMKLIIGLGNPGAKYEATRHNVGFLAVDALAGELGVCFGASKSRGELAEIRHPVHDKVFLLKPQTFMNLSGESAGAVAAFYKIAPADVLAVYDDLDLLPGRLRFAAKGGAGGHNGVKSLIQALGTPEFPRLKIGIGRPLHPGHDVADYVLQKFPKEERERVDKTLKLAVNALQAYLERGIAEAMNAYNGKIVG